MLSSALEVAQLTRGSFDPNVGPLIRADGFSFAKKEQLALSAFFIYDSMGQSRSWYSPNFPGPK